MQSRVQFLSDSLSTGSPLGRVHTGLLYQRYRFHRAHRNTKPAPDTMEAKVKETDDTGARRVSAAENVLREDLNIFETIEDIVKLVDSQLREDDEYAVMGPDPAGRVRALLRKLDSVRTIRERGSKVSSPSESLFHKFVEQVDRIFKNLPKPLKWRSFYTHDLKLLVETEQEVWQVATEEELNKSQTSALEKLDRMYPGKPSRSSSRRKCFS